MKSTMVLWLYSVEQYRSSIPINEIAEHAETNGFNDAEVEVLCLHGYQYIPAEDRELLRKRNFILQDVSPLYASVCARFPNLRRIYPNHFFECFLRWIVLKEYYQGTPILAWDADIFFNENLSRIHVAFAGSTCTSSSTCFVCLSDAHWLQNYERELLLLEASPESYFAEVYRMLGELKRLAPQTFTDSFFGPQIASSLTSYQAWQNLFSLSPEEMFVDSLVRRQVLPHTVAGKGIDYLMAPQLLLLPHLAWHHPMGEDLSAECASGGSGAAGFTKENGRYFFNGKQLAFLHFQGAVFRVCATHQIFNRFLKRPTLIYDPGYCAVERQAGQSSGQVFNERKDQLNQEIRNLKDFAELSRSWGDPFSERDIARSFLIRSDLTEVFENYCMNTAANTACAERGRVSQEEQNGGSLPGTTPVLLLPTGISQLATMVATLRQLGYAESGAKVLSITSCFNEAMAEAMRHACALWKLEYVGNFWRRIDSFDLSPGTLTAQECRNWGSNPAAFVSGRLLARLPELAKYRRHMTVVPARPGTPEDFYYLSALNPTRVVLVADGIQNEVILRNQVGLRWLGFNRELASFPTTAEIWCPDYLALDTAGIGSARVLGAETLDAVNRELAGSPLGEHLKKQVLSLGELPRAIVLSQHFALNQLCSEDQETDYYAGILGGLKQAGKLPVLFKRHPRDPVPKAERLKTAGILDPESIIFTDDLAACVPIECLQSLWAGAEVSVVGSSSSALLGMRGSGSACTCADSECLPEKLRKQILLFSTKNQIARHHFNISSVAIAVRALADQPADAGAWIELGNLTGEAGNLRDALICAEQALAITPRNPAAHIQRAVLCIQTEDMHAAEESALAALGLAPDSIDALRLAAGLCLHNGKPQEAANLYEKLHQLFPTDVDVLLARAQCANALGQGKLAATLCRKVLKLEPGHSEAKRYLAEIQAPAQQTVAVKTIAPSVARSQPVRTKILFVCHEASRSGAPIFLLNLLRWWRANSSREFRVLLRNGGPLESSFREIAETFTLDTFGRDGRLLEDVALIYSNTCTNGLLLESLPSGDIPIVTHVHELGYIIESFGRENFNAVKRQTAHWIACSQAVAAGLTGEQGIEADRISVHYEAIPVEEVVAAAKSETTAEVRIALGIPADAFLIMACGKAEWRKGPDLFVQLAAAISREDLKGRRPTFVWVGLVPEDERGQILRHDLRALGMGNTVQFVGVQDNPHPLLNACDLFVLPSREDPFPLVMLEAAALGKPVVCFDGGGGAREFCARGAGVAVPYLDVQAMARQCIQFIANPELCAGIGAKAATLVRTEFDTAVLGAQLLGRMQTILDAPSGLYASPAQRSLSLCTECEPLLRRGDIVAALKKLSEIAVVDPDDVVLHAELALLQVQNGGLPESEASARRVLALEPKHVGMLRLLAELTRHNRKLAEAADLFSQIARIDKNDVNAVIGKAYCAAAQGQLVLAEIALEQVLRNQPQQPETMALRAYLSGQKNNALEVYFNRPIAREAAGDQGSAVNVLLRKLTQTGIAASSVSGPFVSRPAVFNAGRDMSLSPLPPPVLHRIDTRAEFEILWQSTLAALIGRQEAKAPLHLDAPFDLPGYCVVCGKPSRFTTDFLFCGPPTGSRRSPSWRERQVCTCGLNCRMRSCFHVLSMLGIDQLDSRIYCTEQKSVLFEAIARRFPDVTGSEFFGDRIPLGTADKNRIRNEDITRLTFPDQSFDCVFSIDVLEHVPDYCAGLAEFARCLKPGGKLLLTAPFHFNKDTTIIRATIDPDGNLTHHLPPVYHGDPINSQGCLCFNDFGWDLLDRVRSAGFEDVAVNVLTAEEFGYIGLQYVILATRGAKLIPPQRH